jgi:hypothetical protein
MKDNEKYLNFKLSEVENNANAKFKEKIEHFTLNNDIISHLLDMPLSTFNDKLSGRTQWKLKEFALMCIVLDVTSDEALFGNPAFVTKFNIYEVRNQKEKIKNWLIENKNFETLGKLTAEGFFEKDYPKVAERKAKYK